MPTDLDQIAVTIADDGTATLTGINYNDLRSILTAASLHRYDNPFKAEILQPDYSEIIHDNNLQSALWYLHQSVVLDVIDVRMKYAISPAYESNDISHVKRIHDFKVASLEDDVRESEALVARNVPTPDLVALSAQSVANALRQADSALAALNAAYAITKKTR